MRAGFALKDHGWFAVLIVSPCLLAGGVGSGMAGAVAVGVVLEQLCAGCSCWHNPGATICAGKPVNDLFAVVVGFIMEQLCAGP